MKLEIAKFIVIRLDVESVVYLQRPLFMSQFND